MLACVVALAGVKTIDDGTSSVATTEGHHPCLVATSASDTTFARNFDPFVNPLDFTWGGIYEPLVVITGAGGGHEYPWLATAFIWSKDKRTLMLTIRHGVKWTDGVPLTNRDVAYTLLAGKRQKAMDQIGLTRRGNNVASISVVRPDKVAIRLKERDSTFVSSVLANNLRVVPEHVFATVRDVATWTNPNPVGSGPFAVVQHFDNQAYVLGRNPHYWLKGAPHFACLERVVATSTESAVLQMVQGDIDVTNNYVPNVRKTYASHDPTHYHFFYPAASVPIGLFADDTEYPYSLVGLRRAISMAIDRPTIAREAESGFPAPVDAVGINRVWGSWMDPAATAEAKRLATYDPAAARRSLVAAGFSYDQHRLLDPRGHRVVLEATVIASWADWLATWQIIARNLDDIGISVHLKLAPTWGDWQPAAFATKAATLLWTNAGNGSTPYEYFREHLDRSAFVASGRDAGITGNWEHFQSPEGTRLLHEFRNTFDIRGQHKLAAKLERLWLKTLPFVPLFTGPQWSTYSTKYFVGFPSKAHYYIEPSFLTSDYVVALTRIRRA